MTGKKVFITEGIFDALSLEEMDLQAVSINSTKNISKLTALIKANKDQLKDKLFVLALDNDQSGRDASNQLLNKAINSYSEGPSKYLTLIEGDFNLNINMLKTIVDEKINLTGNKPVIFVDYLQVLTPSNFKITEKQQIDLAIVYLKRLSRDLDLPIVVVSSFNRANYNNNASHEAFKGSGGIEYTADVVMTLQLRNDNGEEFNKIKNMEPRPLELVLLKNRRGKAYEAIELDYWAKQNYFAEGMR